MQLFAYVETNSSNDKMIPIPEEKLVMYNHKLGEERDSIINTPNLTTSKLLGIMHNDICIDIISSTKTKIDSTELIDLAKESLNKCILEYQKQGLDTLEEDTKKNEQILSQEEKNKITTLAYELTKSNNLEDIQQKAITLIPSKETELELLKQYIIQIDYLNTPLSIQQFTDQLNQEINELY